MTKMDFYSDLLLDYRILYRNVICKYFCELLGSIILSACLVWVLYLLWPSSYSTSVWSI